MSRRGTNMNAHTRVYYVRIHTVHSLSTQHNRKAHERTGNSSTFGLHLTSSHSTYTTQCTRNVRTHARAHTHTHNQPTNAKQTGPHNIFSFFSVVLLLFVLFLHVLVVVVFPSFHPSTVGAIVLLFVFLARSLFLFDGASMPILNARRGALMLLLFCFSLSCIVVQRAAAEAASSSESLLLRGEQSSQTKHLKLLMERLDLLERENALLRDRLSSSENSGSVGDGLAAPSFQHRQDDDTAATATADAGVKDTMFVEMEDTGQAKVVETEKEDPTIECQTVCKFVRPNSASKLNAGGGAKAQQAVMQQALGANAEE